MDFFATGQGKREALSVVTNKISRVVDNTQLLIVKIFLGYNKWAHKTKCLIASSAQVIDLL